MFSGNSVRGLKTIKKSHLVGNPGPNSRLDVSAGMVEFIYVEDTAAYFLLKDMFKYRLKITVLVRSRNIIKSLRASVKREGTEFGIFLSSNKTRLI